MEKLKNEIEDLKKQVDDLFSIVVELQIQNLKLLGKLKDLEIFWYEE